MSLEHFYDALKYWLPLVTAFTLVYRLWTHTVDKLAMRITEWANTLFDNHLNHIQDSTERTAAAMEKLIVFQEKAAESVEKVAVDLEQHEADDLQVQQQILQGIEILKDRGNRPFRFTGVTPGIASNVPCDFSAEPFDADAPMDAAPLILAENEPPKDELPPDGEKLL